jgi:hypothetical protein
MKTKYDSIVDTYCGEIPRAVILGLIKCESGFSEKAVNKAPDAPGGGPKIGLMQPSQTGIRDALGVSSVPEAKLKTAVDNIRIGTAILHHYLGKLRKDFPGAFDRPPDSDANAVAILMHAYTMSYDVTAKMMRDAGSTSYRVLAAKYPTERGIARQWGDRVLQAAQSYGYRQILPGAGALVPAPPNVLPGPSPSPGPGPGQKGSILPWVLGAAALGGMVWFFAKKRRRA